MGVKFHCYLKVLESEDIGSGQRSWGLRLRRCQGKLFWGSTTAGRFLTTSPGILDPDLTLLRMVACWLMIFFLFGGLYVCKNDQTGGFTAFLWDDDQTVQLSQVFPRRTWQDGIPNPLVPGSSCGAQLIHWPWIYHKDLTHNNWG